MSKQAYNENYGVRVGAASMASQEPSQDRMLDQMRDRLASLSDEARSIRAQVPHEFEPDVERIQQQMQRLGERLSDLSRGALVPYNPAQRLNETRTKAIRYVTEEDVRVARVRPNDIIALGGPHARPAGAEGMGAWDDAAANALAELYESGEAYAAAVREQARAGSIRPPQSVPARAAQAVYAASSAVAFSSQEPQRGCAMDTNWLDQRFADIAARIEQSLAQIRPENALASLGRRFDQLETQLNSVLGHVATRADLDELRIAEAQIEEIAGQLAQFRRQLARLDVIDAHLGTLTAQLSDERLTRLFNEGVQVTADVGRLDAIDAQLRMIAVQLSDERLTGLVTRSTSRDYEDLAEAAAQRAAASFADTEYRGRDIGEMRGMLENLINERRNSDENNASMLETMQQAIIRVLDRIDALEMMQSSSTSMPAPAQHTPAQHTPAQHMPSHRAASPYMGAPVESAAPMHVEAPAMPASIDDLVPASATVYAEMAKSETDHSDFMPIEDAVEANLRAFREGAEADQAPPRVPYTTASFDLDAAFSRSRDAEAESFGEPQPKRSMEVLRHDFIADAHRAKLKAASRPDTAGADSDVRVGQLSAGPRDAAAKPRRRSIFSFRSQRVAMSLLVLLAAIPAAIFFMPRTAPQIDAIPAAATIAPVAPATALPAAHDAAIPEAAPTMQDPPMMEVAPPAAATPPKQTKQVVPPLEKGEYEDVNADGVPVDTASLPDGITMQDNDASGQQLAQASEQQRMAYLSGQLGAAAAKVTPAALMEEHILKRNGATAPTAKDADFTPANDGAKLPPATVGPFSLRIAAAKGDASAQFEVASRLAEGKGLDQDLKDAAIWYQRSAANGFAMAQFRLGTLYERGLGVKIDAQRAKVWYERAAAQGNVKAMHNLAVLAASADPKGDYEAAARWFQAAADFGLADSQYNLAVLHENGMGVGKDLQQAYKWLLLAAKSGDKDATGRLKALKPKLSDGDVAAAQAQAQEWHPKRMDGLANDARVAGQVWKDTSRRG